MRPRLLKSAFLALVIAVTASAHDLFLKLDSYFLAPNAKATVRLMNGTFSKSDGAVSRERFQHVTLVRPGFDGAVNEAVTWRDEGKTTVMEVQTGDVGTYVVGVSTKPREISLKAVDFNDYLSHDGIPDTLAERKKNNELNKDVVERYSKHVRAVFQVGNRLSDEYKRPLNYSVEVIPQQNPYELHVGQTISVLCTLDGKPLANQFVMAGWESRDGRAHSFNTRSDAAGVARIKLKSAGKWYVKFIHMTPLSDSNLNYESKWASLTFEIKAGRRQ